MKGLAILGAAVAIVAVVVVQSARSRGASTGGLRAAKHDYLRAGDPSRRREIVVQASRLAEPGVVAWLAEVVDNDPALAREAAAALGAVSDKGAAGDLLNIVASKRSTLVRANAARALGTCGGPAQAAVLAAVMRDARQPWSVRQEAALALGRIGQDARRVLTDYARQDLSPAERDFVTRAVRQGR